MNHSTSAEVQSGSLSISADQLKPGTKIELAGKWFFKPASAIKGEQSPEKAASSDGYLTIPVPQMLSRIQWWLDDSEDFKKWEQARLDALGFDTEKNDDGWYRLEFDVPEIPKGRTLWIEFDGVAMKCRTFCNGQLLGEDKGMFHRFGYDLTPHLKAGKNVLSMWVSMEKIPPTSAQLGEAVTVNLSAAKVVSMSKGMFGPLTANQDNRAYDLYGIWQPVRFVVRGNARIDDVWFQPALDGAKITVDAHAPGMGQAKVRAKLSDAKTGEQLVEWTGQLARAEAISSTVTLGGNGLKPKLWTPAHPNLYKLEVTVDGDDVQDRWTQEVGFRTFEIKGNQFYLNGKPYWLRGANQAPYGKNPWDPELARKTVQFMHDGNQRFTRTHATPWNEAWLDTSDEIGLAVSVEGIRPWAFAGRSDQIGHEVMPPPEIFQHWLMENEDVVKRCRNHPSVFIFTVGNEMMLRDGKNMEKWKLMSEVTKQTRKLAPRHPIICSSDYTRDPEFYESTLKPAGIDDGDIDDMHRYSGWYGPSNFLINSQFEREMKANAKARPLMGQEFSTGYPDLDSGLPVLRYTRDLLTPQAWIGHWAYPGNDHSIFLNHLAIVTKRWAEQLRYQRGDNTAGFALFSSECWYKHSYDPRTIEKYEPVYSAVKDAWAPVGVAIETPQRRFYIGAELSTNVFVTNDDEQGRDLSGLRLIAELQPRGKQDAAPIAQTEVGRIDQLNYYQTASVPIKFKLEAPAAQRTPVQLVIRLFQGDKEISKNEDSIELFPRAETPAAPANLVVVKAGAALDDLAEGKPLHQKIAAGATAIVFAPDKAIVAMFPNELLDVKVTEGEFADWLPAQGTRLAAGLAPMDLKWWAKKSDPDKAYISTQSHRLKDGGKARELIRFIPSHGYIADAKVPEQYRSVMSEIPIGKGRLWICDLDLEGSVGVDPAADLFAKDLYEAAGDPDSTKNLKPVPSHEEFLKGGGRAKLQLE